MFALVLDVTGMSDEPGTMVAMETATPHGWVLQPHALPYLQRESARTESGGDTRLSDHVWTEMPNKSFKVILTLNGCN